ncbi:MAG: 5-formyltetrahydrofolate cyclo-ligase [Prevotellaceae bacterium]|jgi:5-formyltetrahydrofolate cyclo-ligase|nr:5-formyltetrahydrofolate cyclo-ligase [Prevotellaceae bacterium]
MSARISGQKRDIRKHVKNVLTALTHDQLAIKSQTIFSKVERLEQFSLAKNILAYWPIPKEVQTEEFILCWYKTKNVYLPIVHENHLKIGIFTGLECLGNANHLGINEPKALELTPSIDLAIIPGLAFDKENNRLGRGKGYYDKFLKTTSAFKLGVCFSEQLLDDIPHDELDVKMDKVITD